MGVPEAVLAALEARFLADGGAARSHPLPRHRDRRGHREAGCHRFAHLGLVGRVIGGNYGLQLPFMKLIARRRDRGLQLPAGRDLRSSAARWPPAAGRDHAMSGLQTYMDPRQDGGTHERAHA